LVRETLVEALERALRCANIRGAASLEEATARPDIARPTLVLIDASLRGAATAARRLRRRDRTTRLIAFNMDGATRDTAGWTEVGIDAYLGRSLALTEIVERIGTLLNGPPAGSRIVARSARKLGGAPSYFAGAAVGVTAMLTAREEEVVQLIIAGESNKEIARSLDISVATVKSHVHNLLGKLGLAGRGKLALRYEGIPSSAGHVRVAD
jgi:DNA-binding NarL/FixJ family response regulator